MRINLLSKSFKLSLILICWIGIVPAEVGAKSIEENVSESTENTKSAREYYELGIEADRRGNKKSAIENMSKSLEQFTIAGDIKNKIVASLYLSQLYIETGLVSKVEPIVKKALLLADRENLTQEKSIGREILGNLYLRYDRYNEAIEQYKKSLELDRNSNSLIQLSRAYYEKGNTEDLRRGYDRAVEAVELSQTLKQKINSRISILKYYKSNLSKEQIDQYKKSTIELINSVPSEDFKANKLIAVAKLSAPTEAIEYLEGARNLAEELGSRYTESLANEELGKIYLNNNKLIQAKEYTDRSLLISQAIPSPERSFYQSWQLAKIALAKGNKPEAIDLVTNL